MPLLLVVAASGCGTASVSEPLEQTPDTIAGGTLDETDAGVFQIFTQFDDAVSACTASLISPNVLLTARHCISRGNTENVVCGRSPFSAPVDGSDTVATNATKPSSKSTFYHGADIRVPSDGSDLCGFDMALIILEAPVPASQATPLVPRIDLPVQSGEPYRAVGYGLDEGGKSTPGRMVRGDLEVACLPAECPRIGVAATEFLGETGVCSGDSGGPAIDEEGKVIGVVSRGSDPCETPIYGQVSSWAGWITATVLEAAASGGFRPPFWAYSGSSELDPTLAQAGEPCSDTSECTAGTVCYFESEPSGAVCTPVCANSRQCKSGQACRDGFDVEGGGLCFDIPGSTKPPTSSEAQPPSPPPGEDKCSVAPGDAGSGLSAWLVTGLGLATATRIARRRRR